jgi:hypothetical protein
MLRKFFVFGTLSLFLVSCGNSNQTNVNGDKTESSESGESSEEVVTVDGYTFSKLAVEDIAVFQKKYDGKKVIVNQLMVNTIMDYSNEEGQSYRKIEAIPYYKEEFNGKTVTDGFGSYVGNIDGKDHQLYNNEIFINLSDPTEISKRMPDDGVEKNEAEVDDYGVSKTYKYFSNQSSIKVSGIVTVEPRTGRITLTDGHIVK